MFSLARYTQLLDRPGMRPLFLASLLGRLPIGISGLAILLLAQQASGSFALGGLASASYVAGLSIAAPLLGRSIDRFGPRRTLRACALLHPSALATLVAAFALSAPAWVSLALAAAAGASFPPITACMRAFFRQELREEAQLAVAYSLESVLIEFLFIAGPLLVALFVAYASPEAALLFACTCAFAGALRFASNPALERWRIVARRGASLAGPLGEPRFVRLLAVIVLYSAAFGLVEIAVTAHAAERGAPPLAGVLLGAMSVGGVFGGLAYGARTWSAPAARQFPLALASMGAGIAPLALALPLWAWALACALAGATMAPALILQSMLVARCSRSEHSAEAFTWSATGLLAGIGIGLAVGGELLEAVRPPAVFVLAAALSVAAGALALRFARTAR
jgi:MFS family permease